MTAYRFSISWTRILPEGTPGNLSQAGVQYYGMLIESLLAANITPMVTMYHWDLPEYLHKKGGWLNIETADAFYYYADALFTQFGSKVRCYACA